MEIRYLDAADADRLAAAGHLFDEPVDEGLAQRFLADPAHHCFLAYEGAEPVGFVTGVAIRHPDKRTEMLLYELGVDEPWRRRGIGRALVEALRERAREAGMRGMWVLTEPGDEPALATYRSAGAEVDEGARVLEWRLTSDG